jgi:uncharacterized protein YcfJ
MPRNREFDVAAERRHDATFDSNQLVVPNERARPAEFEAGDVHLSDSVVGMMIAAVSGSVVGLLASGGPACAALVFAAAIIGVYAGWHARGVD